MCLRLLIIRLTDWFLFDSNRQLLTKIFSENSRAFFCSTQKKDKLQRTTLLSDPYFDNYTNVYSFHFVLSHIDFKSSIFFCFFRSWV